MRSVDDGVARRTAAAMLAALSGLLLRLGALQALAGEQVRSGRDAACEGRDRRGQECPQCVALQVKNDRLLTSSTSLRRSSISFCHKVWDSNNGTCSTRNHVHQLSLLNHSHAAAHAGDDRTRQMWLGGCREPDQTHTFWRRRLASACALVRSRCSSCSASVRWHICAHATHRLARC